MKRICGLALMAAVAGFMIAAPAQAAKKTPQIAGQQGVTSGQEQVADAVAPEHERSWLGRFFAKFYETVTGKVPDPDPTPTLTATFGTGDGAAVDPAGHPLLPGTGGLDQPHRSPADLAHWLEQAMAETLSFSADTYGKHLTLMQNGYTPEAIAQFNSWLATSHISEQLQKNQLQLNGFVTDTPFLLNEGTLDGRYRWLFEVPVMISFVPRGSRAYDQPAADDNSRRLIVTLQLGRVTDSKLPDGVRIESWTVTDNTRKN